MGPRVVLAGFSLFFASGLRAEWSLAVINGSGSRTNWVVSQTITREWAGTAGTCGLVEVSKGHEVPVPFAVDSSGETPVLVWLMPGPTAPDQSRNFSWVTLAQKPAAATDLAVSEVFAGVAVSNGYYRLRHPAHGGGGFPRDIVFGRSGAADPDLFFYDRIVRPRPTGAGVVSYCAKECEDAESRVVFRSPLRVTVEVNTGYGPHAAETPGRPAAVYRYVYTAYSPVVEVSARCSRNDDGPWREQHFLHLSRSERGRYENFVVGDPASEMPMQAKGARSRSVSGSQWALMANGRDACGVGLGGSFGWDASDEFVYYVRRCCMPWTGRVQSFAGGLYLGPSGDGSWYSRWLGRERCPEIQVRRDGKACVPVEREPLVGSYELRGRGQRLAFAGAPAGFDCLGVENLLAGGARFVRARPDVAGLWSLVFRAPPDADGRTESVVVDNRAGGVESRSAERGAGGLTFRWRGLDLPGETGVVDVCAEIRLAPGGDASEWRLQVASRSRRYGLFQSEYPLLRAVVPAGAGDVLLPRGNWGGSLVRRSSDAYVGRYPSHGCPVQLMAFNLGEAGLCLAAHDGAAGNKELSVSAEQDATFRALAPNAGLPGAAGGPDFPVVVSCYAGDWWQAARLYREWAVRQPWTAKGPIALRGDYPRRLAEVGFWMQLGGEPAGILRNMEAAAHLMPGVPLGVHWYCWHQIPFDNSYPEYFPARPGMAEATRALESRGVTVMPYINARLWDRDIPSFAGAWAAACKQPGGTSYVETYGSGRNLVPMCPRSDLWQAKIREVCGRLMEECGVGGIYLDQIGSAAPVACYDRSHGHPAGGGSHWVSGYHAMLGVVKAEASRRNVALTTEDSAEPYMDMIDGCLAWNPRYQEDVPLLPAIYSGYTTYFTSPQSSLDTLDAFCAQQGRDFLWGCQLGWNGDWILKAESHDKLAFQAALCRCRLAAKAFLVYGRLVDDVRPDSPVPRVRQVWHRNQPHEASVPAVMGTVWTDGRKERLAAVVVNVSGETQRLAFSLDPARWLGRGGPWRLALLDEHGETPLLHPEAEVVIGDLPPRSVRVVTVSPSR